MECRTKHNAVKLSWFPKIPEGLPTSEQIWANKAILVYSRVSLARSNGHRHSTKNSRLYKSWLLVGIHCEIYSLSDQ